MGTRCIVRLLTASIIGPALIAVLSGCVARQAIRLQHAPGTGPKLSSSKTVAVDAKDSRSFIVNGDKKPSYLGHFRAGYGNTWDVNNAGYRALADQFKADIAAELKAQGIKTVASGERTIQVDIKDWNFDTYQNGKIWYEISVSVTDRSGSVLATTSVKDQKVIRGSFWTGPAAAFKREVPIIYSGIIKEILAKDEIQKALQ